MNTPTSGTDSAGLHYSKYDNAKDVAVVGMACRVPGGNNNPEQLWQSLLERKDACGEVPEMRWEAYHRRDPRNPKTMNQLASRGYFLDDVENFDAQFFGISPKEAEQMDPQQRISLEVTWEALENAGIPAKSLSGSDTAVFWGVSSDDYAKLILEDLPNIEPWMGIGTAFCGTPNRISYHLNLMGPSSAIDAACASSLVAIHHGVQSIASGESRMAIVGGGNVLCGPALFCVLERAGALSTEGRCRSFDNEARGFGRGEGAAAIIFKNISDAIQDGDEILAVIKGTAVAQDGKTNGIMAPNAISQQLVARKALGVAKVDPSTVRYIEAHATSTPLGDFTEVSALAGVYGTGRRDDPCFVGSIKPNIGHLEGAAGAIGFVKAVMALRNSVLPPQANLQVLNKRIDWENSGLKVVQEQTAWPETDEVRRAAVCSYGYGGTVSHAVLEQYISSRALPMDENPHHQAKRPSVLLISAPEKKRIPAQARILAEWINSQGRQHDMHLIASTLALRRDHHNHRAALVVNDHDDAIQLLGDLAAGSNQPWATQGNVLSENSRGLVWVFSGHGAHWPDMGKEMLNNKYFHDAIQPLDAIVYSEIGLSPMGLLESGQFESSDQLQILTYIVQIGLCAVLQSYGIFPRAIIGHSTGEIAASVVAGALTPEEGAIVVTQRSVLYRRLSGQGKMILVHIPFADVLKELPDSGNLTAAIDCSPSSCVVAGPGDAVARASEALKQRGIKVFDVRTDIAFHSPMMNQLKDPLITAISDAIKPTIPTRARLYSTSLKDPRGQDLRDASYWANNMMNPVHFTSAIQAASEDSYHVFMEISSHPLVCHSIDEILAEKDNAEHCVVPSLVRNKPAEKTLLHSISQLHNHGVPVDWGLQMSKSWAVGLPNTNWLHKPIWRKVETSPFDAIQTHNVEEHTLLGQRIEVASTDTIMYTTRLDSNSKPYPQSHPVQGTEIIPAAVYIMTLLNATRSRLLKNVNLIVPIAVDTPRFIQVVAQRENVKVLSRLIKDNQATEDDFTWITHATSQLSVQLVMPESSMDISATIQRIGNKLDKNFSVDYLAKVGVSAMGFLWAITEHHGSTKEMIARVDTNPNPALDEQLPWDPSSWAPIFDAATSVGSTIFFNDPKPRMVAQINQVDVFTRSNPPRIGWLHVRPASSTPPASDVTILDEDGSILAKLTSMRFAEIESTQNDKGNMDSLVHQVTWQPAMPAEEPLPINQIVLVSEDISLREKWAKTVPAKAKKILASSAEQLASINATCPLGGETAIVYLPSGIQSLEDVTRIAEDTTWQLLELLKFVVRNAIPAKVFALTEGIGEGEDPTALAHSPLVGLSRILASEHPEQFGGLIDTEVLDFPLTTIRYIRGADVIRIRDGVARIARLRSLPRHKLLSAAQGPKFFTRADGTYLITGGLGGLGLEVAEFLVDQGARRIVLISRRALPPRKMWDQEIKLASAISKIKALESRGATVYALALDISVPSAAEKLSSSLDQLSLPPVRGVIHAAGVLENQLALNTTKDAFARVLAPKITGALVLHEVFPPQSVDFFILFSSCGQLVGSTGQSSYASSNAFLDSLATHRRARGDYALAFQWAAWREVGMAAGSEYVQAEFEAKGVTDIGRDEAFEAWIHAAKYDVDHCVVLRSLPVEEGKDVPSAILKDIAPRFASNTSSQKIHESSSVQDRNVPRSGEKLKAHVEEQIRDCVAQVLHMIPDEIENKAVLSDLGLDSVMTVHLRRQLQSALNIQVPPTLTWSHPTISHLAGWFAKKMDKN